MERMAVLTQSLGWHVPTEWIARDFKIKGKLPNEVESFFVQFKVRGKLSNEV